MQLSNLVSQARPNQPLRAIRAGDGWVCRAVLKLFFLSGEGAKLLPEVENMAALQSFTLGGSGGDDPPGNFGNFRCSEVDSRAI